MNWNFQFLGPCGASREPILKSSSNLHIQPGNYIHIKLFLFLVVFSKTCYQDSWRDSSACKNTNTVAHSHLYLEVQGIWHSVLASRTSHFSVHTYTQAKHSYTLNKNKRHAPKPTFLFLFLSFGLSVDRLRQCIKKEGASKMVQWMKIFAAKTTNLSSTPEYTW